jgi:hypothetical protein
LASCACFARARGCTSQLLSNANRPPSFVPCSKARFRCLRYGIWLRDANEKYYSGVFACCLILHNLCLRAKDEMDRSEVEQIMMEEAQARSQRFREAVALGLVEDEGRAPQPAVAAHSTLEQGRAKRLRIMNDFFW